jgi:putative endonuclease
VAAENLAAAHLAKLGWEIVARNVTVGRDEIDIVAIDSGPPPEIVCVEVRSATSVDFGTPEERVDRPKVGHLYRAMWALKSERRLPKRVDLLVVDSRQGSTTIRHLKRLEPV